MRVRRAQHIGRTPAPARSLTPLLVQAGAGSSLASIMAFVSAGLLLLGTWVLMEMFDHPLQAQPTEAIAAAVMITLASILLFRLLSPRSSPGSGRHRHKAAMNHPPHEAHLAPVIDVQAKTQSEVLPFATRFADPHVTGD